MSSQAARPLSSVSDQIGQKFIFTVKLFTVYSLLFVAEVEINECVSKIRWTEQHLTIPVKTILLVSLS